MVLKINLGKLGAIFYLEGHSLMGNQLPQSVLLKSAFAGPWLCGINQSPHHFSSVTRRLENNYPSSQVGEKKINKD